MADSREFRSKFFVSNLTFLGILLGILVMVYFLGTIVVGAKWDLTRDKVYTISPSMKQILGELKDDIKVRYYLSEAEKIPSQLSTLRRDTIDLFRELEAYSSGHFKYEVIAPEVEARDFARKKSDEYFEKKSKGETPKEPEQKESIEDMLFSGRQQQKKTDDQIREQRQKKAEILAERQKRTSEEVFKTLLREEFEAIYLGDLQKQGVYAVPMEERKGDSRVETTFYTSLEIKYLDKQPEVIPLYYQIQSLEYELANKVLKLTQKHKPKILFFDGRKPDAPPPNPMNPMQQGPQSDYSAIVRELGELFDIDEITLKEGNSVTDILKRIEEDLQKKDDDKSADEKPSKISCLVVAQPDNLEARQLFEISRAVSEGVPTIFLISSYSIDASRQGLQQGFPIATLRSGLDDLFRSWGITLGKEIVASKECATINVPQRMGGFVMNAPYPMPVLLKAVGDAINKEHALTNRIPALIFPAAVGLSVNDEEMKKAGLDRANAIALARSGKQSYTVAINPFEQNMFNQVQPPSVLKKKELSDRRFVTEGFIEPKTLALLVTGKFPFKYQDQPIPEWKKEEKDPHAKMPGGFPGGIPGLNFPQGPDGPQDPDGPKGPRGPVDDVIELAQAPAPAAGQTPPVPAPAPAPAPQTPPPAPAPVPAPPVAPPPAAIAPAVGAAPSIPFPVPVPPSAAAPAAADAAKADPVAPPEAKKEPERAKVDLKDGKILLLTSADMMKNDFLTQSQEYQPNAQFFYNVIENFGLDDRLLQIRRRERTESRFLEGASERATFITILNLVLIPVAAGGFGLVRWILRRGDSQSYERAYIEKHSQPK